MTKSLVTGAAGFIGRNLVEALVSSGREVIAMVHRERGHAIFEQASVEVLVADIRDEARYASAVERADEVFHLASDVSPKRVSVAREVNVIGTQRLAKSIAGTESPARLVYVSSLSASGPCLDDQPRRESDEAQPVSIYGKTKLAAEQTLREFSGQLPITVVRPPGVFGPWDRNLLAMFKSLAWRVNAIAVSRRFRYSFVHVEDLVQGMLAASERGRRLGCASDDDQEGIYFIGDSEALSFEQLGNLIAETMRIGKPFHFTVPSPICLGVAFCSDWYRRLLGKRVYLNIDKIREARGGSWVCNCTRAAEQLDFAPAKSLADRIIDTHQWYVDQSWLS